MDVKTVGEDGTKQTVQQQLLDIQKRFGDLVRTAVDETTKNESKLADLIADVAILNQDLDSLGKKIDQMDDVYWRLNLVEGLLYKIGKKLGDEVLNETIPELGELRFQLRNRQIVAARTFFSTADRLHPKNPQKGTKTNDS